SGENRDVSLSSANGDAVVNYIFSGDLKPIADLKVEIQNLVEELQSKDWTKVFDLLNNAQWFALFHSVLLIPFFGQSNSGVDGGSEESEECIMQEFIMASADLFNNCPSDLDRSDWCLFDGDFLVILQLVFIMFVCSWFIISGLELRVSSFCSPLFVSSICSKL
ncbi:hypothetical protein Dimus_033684, partial [Dionaea muscipula]